METILIVDDSNMSRSVLSDILSEDYKIIEAENGEEGLKAIKENKLGIAAVMLDLVMPVMNGYTVLERVKKSELYGVLPILVITSESKNHNEKRAFEMGAWDFISKPFDGEVIKFRLKNAINRSQLTAFKRLKYIAEYDILTGIYNKSKFFAMTMEMLHRYPDEQFIFLRFDIDRFQLINSFYGTQEGDRLLQFIAKKIVGFLDETHICTYGRIEADIFGICIPYYEETLQSYLEKARKVLESFNRSYDIVPTFGLYIITDIKMPIDQMYDRASLAAKKCKGSYVNYFAFYDEQMSKSIEKEQDIINNMNTALEKEQFVVYMQPKYNLTQNTPVGAEALVRWRLADNVLIPPGDFIPVFERNGFISKMDFFVWETVCKLIRKWLDEGKKMIPVSVNVSRVNLYNPQIVDIIAGLTKKYDIPNNLLHLELTETAYTDNPTAMREVINKLQAKGFTILMDDFGSGYSSLNLLKDIAVDILKIDMKFLAETQIEGRGENIIASVIRMAKWLNIPVVAEGAETKQQVDFLRSVGCEYCQGFYFAKPMPIDQYEELMTEKSQVFQEDALTQNEFDKDLLWSLTPQMEMLFNNGFQAVAIYEFDGETVELIRKNKTFSAFIDPSSENFNGDMASLVGSAYKNQILAAFQHAVDYTSTSQCEYMRKDAKNEWIWIDLKLKYLSRVGNKHILFGTLTDVTMQKEIDSELQRYKTLAALDSTDTYTMLILDPDAQSRKALVDTFKEEYTIVESEDYLAAAKRMNGEDTIHIMVLNMSDFIEDANDFLLFKKINPNMASVPTIAIISDSSEENQKNILALGITEYIVRPFISETIKRRVKNVLGSNKQ